MKKTRGRVLSTDAEVAALLGEYKKLRDSIPASIPDPYIMEYSSSYLLYLWLMIGHGSTLHLIALKLNANAFSVGARGTVGRPFQFRYWS